VCVYPTCHTPVVQQYRDEFLHPQGFSPLLDQALLGQ
jgi:hypothetical protein